ncbi:molybdopterin molybdotransferase MoeA [Thalassotalea sp. 1_MG-2023]|uniref:molybdopterin molybdotransferase MoeA n=1 Tax=Thalassotalea sp. 1_MG-2023 TaxID=3062680 RepID=UPI0034A5A3CE
MMNDCCSAPGLMPFEQALNQMLAEIKPLTASEEISFALSYNRVLAKNVYSPVNVPPMNNSAMDGYAFKHAGADINSLTVIGRSMAGKPFLGACQQGECVRIMTGAAMPKGCDTVIMQEQCQQDGNIIHLQKQVPQCSNVRNVGEDIKQGALVFEQGKRLTSIDVGVLASLGIAEVPVVKPIKVALFSTGDELKNPGEPLSIGDIYESNSHFLQAMLTKFGADVIPMGIISDDEEQISQALVSANEQADVVITSGGVSVGDADYIKAVLDKLGHIDFWKVAIKPGKPFAFGHLPSSYFFGLPGNPVSALVTAHQLVLPALAKLQNINQSSPVRLSARSNTPLKKAPGRMDFQRGVMQANTQGQLTVTSTGSQGSGMLTSMAKANCYIVLSQEQGNVQADEQVTVLPFDQYLQ